MTDTDDPRRFAPSAARNREPLAEVLIALQRDGVLPQTGQLLEIAAGSGEHAVHLAPRLPGLAWVATDRDPAAVASIAAWRAAAPADNLLPPVLLDVAARPWPVARADVVLAINLVHISPWSCTLDLVAGAAAILPAGGALVTYGAYRVGGEHTAPSNVSFDAWLRAQDPSFGVRDLEQVVAAAADVGLAHARTIPMPANNFVLVFTRSP